MISSGRNCATIWLIVSLLFQQTAVLALPNSSSDIAVHHLAHPRTTSSERDVGSRPLDGILDIADAHPNRSNDTESSNDDENQSLSRRGEDRRPKITYSISQGDNSRGVLSARIVFADVYRAEQVDKKKEEERDVPAGMLKDLYAKLIADKSYHIGSDHWNQIEKSAVWVPGLLGTFKVAIKLRDPKHIIQSHGEFLKTIAKLYDVQPSYIMEVSDAWGMQPLVRSTLQYGVLSEVIDPIEIGKDMALQAGDYTHGAFLVTIDSSTQYSGNPTSSSFTRSSSREIMQFFERDDVQHYLRERGAIRIPMDWSAHMRCIGIKQNDGKWTLRTSFKFSYFEFGVRPFSILRLLGAFYHVSFEEMISENKNRIYCSSTLGSAKVFAVRVLLGKVYIDNDIQPESVDQPDKAKAELIRWLARTHLLTAHFGSIEKSTESMENSFVTQWEKAGRGMRISITIREDLSILSVPGKRAGFVWLLSSFYKTPVEENEQGDPALLGKIQGLD